MRIHLKFVYKVCPAPIFYVWKFTLKGFMGNTRGFVVLIRRDHIDDKPVLEHELIHVRQFYRFFPLCFIHSFLYLFWERYRLSCEIEAYKKQLSLYDDAGPFVYDRKLIGFAMSLTKNYGLKITQLEAEEMLS